MTVMPKNDDQFQHQGRKTPTHEVMVSPTAPTIVFLTVCTKDRVPRLNNSQVHKQLDSIWREADTWLVGKYLIMPDHVHLFVAPSRMEISLDNWVKYWKSQFTKKHGDKQHRWQSHHWDKRLRRVDSYAQKWNYVRNNPVRRGLVKEADDWPYQGEIHVLRWDNYRNEPCSWEGEAPAEPRRAGRRWY